MNEATVTKKQAKKPQVWEVCVAIDYNGDRSHAEPGDVIDDIPAGHWFTNPDNDPPILIPAKTKGGN